MVVKAMEENVKQREGKRALGCGVQFKIFRESISEKVLFEQRFI